MIHHVYANQSNAGDWLSARGIQALLAPREVREHFCDEPFVPQTMAELEQAGPDDFIIIGGGGLFMDYFAPFWAGFEKLAGRVPFAIWGAGACDMKREHSRPPIELVSKIVKQSRLCVVRDELTREIFRGCELPPPVVCPVFAALTPTGGEQKRLLHVDHYNNVGADNYERMVGMAEEFAERTGRSCRQTNNLISAGHNGQLKKILDLYISSDLVLTSRLHGCIIALALGRRVLAVSGDHKVESFMNAAGLGEWVCDLEDIDSLPARLEQLPEQKLPLSFIDEGRRQNREVAEKIIALLPPMKAIVTGMIASYPVGGVLWDYGQYGLGLERLGYEVYYLEDTGWQTYDPNKGEYGEDCSYAVDFLKRSLAKLSPTLGVRWRFRNLDGKTYGLDDETFARVLREADLFLNVSGGTLLRDEYMACKRKVLIDSDPGWNHFRNFPKWDANPNWQGSHGYRAHDFFFTYAERMGKPGCTLPDFGLPWQPTRPPVVMDQWQPAPPGGKWTTVMTWKNFQETIQHDGTLYGTKEMEFGKVEQLPARTKAKLEIAVGGDTAPREHWRQLGWSVVDSQAISRTADGYRDYIRSSRGEFSVAKNVYVATRCGWFSCRSVCYLAAGLPVVVQDTGFSEFIPGGEGLFAFSNVEEAAQGIEAVEKDHARHGRAANDLARRYFASEVVLGDLLRRTGL